MSSAAVASFPHGRARPAPNSSSQRSPLAFQQSAHHAPPNFAPRAASASSGGLGLLVVTANFVFTWRATSVARAHAEEHLASNNGDNTVDAQNGGQNPQLQQERDAFSADDVQLMEKQLVYTLHQTAQRTTEKRGIVLPMFDGIATLGLSLIMELRALSVDLPIEVPHCGDFKESQQRAVLEKEDMGVIRFYDVCELASQTASTLDPSRKVFCQSLRNCHRSYRSFDVKLLAMTFSQFEEIMLLDADTLFFESPMSLWDTEKYRNTGTLELNRYISRFDVSPFAPLGNIERPKATSENKILHSWNHRAGHEMDSSLVLWNKKRQPRATAMLAAFAALNGIGRPPSYGDKELFFIAVELAETQYAFSDFGVGGVGWDFRDNGPGKSIVCGHASHYYPVKPANASAVANTSVLYLNSDAIMEYNPKKKPVYYSQAQLYEVYAGSFECPFDVTGVRFSSAQEDRMLLRQRFHEIAEHLLSIRTVRSFPHFEEEPKSSSPHSVTNTLVLCSPLRHGPPARLRALRWIVLLLAAGVIFVLSDVLFTWRSSHFSLVRCHVASEGQRLSRVQKLTELVDRLSESEATDLLRKIDPKTTTAATAAITAAKTAALVPLQEVEAMKEENHIKMLESQLLHSLHTITQKTTAPRGIVLPLYDDLDHATRGDPALRRLEPEIITTIEKRSKQLGQVYVYDVCDLATKEKSLLDASNRFLQRSGRDQPDQHVVGFRPASRLHSTDLRHYLSNADVSVFRQLPTLQREKATPRVEWRSGHQMDSSLLLWSKNAASCDGCAGLVHRAQRVGRPPSYGDKELFFVACELAETNTLSRTLVLVLLEATSRTMERTNRLFAVSGAVLSCEAQDESVASLLYLNSGAIMEYKPKTQPLYYSKRILLRQRLHDIAVEWERNALMSENESEQTQADALNYLMARHSKRLLLRPNEPAAITPHRHRWNLKQLSRTRERAELEKQMETRLIHSLHTLSQQTSVPRGSYSRCLRRNDHEEERQLGEVYVYNACKIAATAKSLLDPTKQLFCKDLDNCHRRFRNFAIKANFSMGLGYKPANRPNIMAIEDYLSKAEWISFATFRHLHDPTHKSTVTLHFQPSEGLLKSHPWNGRSAHRVDSSILLWNKKRQPRATAILASIISLNDVPRPPSYGDKESSLWLVNLQRPNFRNKGENKSIICGSAAHHFPEKSEDTPIQEVGLLYMNTDYIMRYKPKKAPMYYSAARRVISSPITDAEAQQIYQRQHFFGIAKEWEDDAKEPTGAEREAAETLTNENLEVLLDRMKNGPPLEDALIHQRTRTKTHRKRRLQKQEKQLVHTLNQIAQQTTVKRGIVIPVYDGIIKLAISLVLELRTIGINEPIEMPHCGDLDEDAQIMYLTKKQLGTIWFYNVCAKAERATSVMDSSRKVFCEKIEDCHAKFRGFIIKPLAVTFSRFEEIMMIDADTTFFYNKTGNFLMHDRISHEIWFMAERVPGKPDVSVEQNYFATFDNPTSVTLNFEPSDFLLVPLVQSSCGPSSGLVAGVVEQEAATARYCDSGVFHCAKRYSVPPSYGDKEFFFYASELAEAQYSFSDHAIGAVGTKLIDGGPKNSTLCGDMAQVFPIHQDGVPDDDVPLFYLTVTGFVVQTQDGARVLHEGEAVEFYPGPFGERKQESLPEEERHLAGRQHIYEAVDAWHRVAKEKPANLDEQNVAIDGVLRKVIAEMQGKSPADATGLHFEPDHAAYNDQARHRDATLEPIARLGLSLILELRAMGITLPIEVPHCTDLKLETVELIRTKKELGEIRAYDVCELAASAKVSRMLRVQCSATISMAAASKFRSFMINLLPELLAV
ncbi:Nucleotide-diphospho-sugar transferase [Phytophthora cactorum]|nr:Nucleotide-diphospho-sugar transferase [Phytophthora cactorum]